MEDVSTLTATLNEPFGFQSSKMSIFKLRLLLSMGEIQTPEIIFFLNTI